MKQGCGGYLCFDIRYTKQRLLQQKDFYADGAIPRSLQKDGSECW